MSRALLPRRCGFWLSGPVLVSALLCELVLSVVRMILWPLVGATARRRREIRRILLDGMPAPLMVLAMAIAVCAGCSTPNGHRPTIRQNFPGTSFGHQVSELEWTMRELFFDETPAENLRELGGDAGRLLGGTSVRELGADLSDVLWDPHSLSSLGEDLGILLKPETGQFSETLRMLGW